MFLLLERKHLRSRKKKKNVTAHQTLHLSKQRRAQRYTEALQLTFPTKQSGALPLVLDVSLHFVQLLSKHSAGLEIQHTLVAGAAGGRRISYWSRAESTCSVSLFAKPLRKSSPAKSENHASFFHFVSQEGATAQLGTGRQSFTRHNQNRFQTGHRCGSSKSFTVAL